MGSTSHPVKTPTNHASGIAYVIVSQVCYSVFSIFNKVFDRDTKSTVHTKHCIFFGLEQICRYSAFSNDLHSHSTVMKVALR